MLYLVGLLLAFIPRVSSAMALAMGVILSLGLNLPLPKNLHKLSKYLLQASIVFLGFSMDPSAVWRAGIGGVGITLASLVLTFLIGFTLRKLFKLENTTSVLITVGTAICGGSAIAAIAPIVGAVAEEITIALGIVFLLNSAALLFFPILGTWLNLSAQGFGYLAAIAIHDTSSVVGAAAQFSEAAVPFAVTIKLTRALWIVPLALVFAAFIKYTSRGTDKKVTAKIPWFIPFFVAAVGFRAFFPDLIPYSVLGQVGRSGLNGAIFLISSQMSRAQVQRIGLRPLLFALSLWAMVIVGTIIFVVLKIA